MRVTSSHSTLPTPGTGSCRYASPGNTPCRHLFYRPTFSQQPLDDRVRHVETLLAQPDVPAIVLDQALPDEPRQSFPDERVQLDAGLRPVLYAVNAVAAPQLHGHRLAGPLLRPQCFRLHRRRLAGEATADVRLEVARVQLAPAADVTGCPHAEAEVGVVEPVRLVVPAAPPGAREIRDLV